MNKQESIIIALCRCALSGNPTDATKHQIVRLQQEYMENGSSEMARRIEILINPEPNELDGLRIVQSNTPDEEVIGI